MIICRRCSRRHADGTEFCTCGAFLEFDGERAPDAEPTTGSATSAVPDAGASTRPAAQGAGNADPWSGLPGDSQRDDTHAVRPDDLGSPARPVGDLAGPAATRTGGRPCPSCRTPNPPEASFCRRCALDLRGTSGIVAQERTRTKRRWFGGREIDPRDVANRVRRARRGRLSRRVMMFRAGGPLIALTMLAAFLGPWGRPALAKLRDELRLNRYDQIQVDARDVTARPAGAVDPVPDLPYHTPDLVVDGFSNTSWATRWIDPADIGDDLPDEGCVRSGAEQVLVVDFGTPTSIDRVQVLPGRSADDPTRDDVHRPRTLQFEHDGDCRRVVVDDVGALSPHGLSLDDVTTLTVAVVGIYEGDSTDSTVEIGALVFEQR